MNQFKYIKGTPKHFIGAPEWAMVVIRHANRETYDFAATLSQGSRAYFCIKQSEGAITSPSEWVLVARRELVPLWDGCGPPPAGIECEFSTHDGSWGWTRGVVQYLSDATVVATITGPTEHDAVTEFVKHPGTVKFRPVDIKSERAREDTLRKITAAICCGTPGAGYTLAYCYACRVLTEIEAGKIPGIKID